MEKIEIELPKGYMNVGISNDNILFADTNNSADWDTLKFPLPEGKWDIFSNKGKKLTLIKRKMKEVVSIIVQNNKGEYLAVSRRNDYNDFSLPGGKVDDGETPIQAIIRETEEETTLTAYNLILMHVENRKDEIEYTYTGRVQGIVPEIQPCGEGVIKWADKEEILKGSFGEYNKRMIEKFESK